MKIIKLKQDEDRDEFNVEKPYFEYQGKRREQVEGSYRIFVWSLLLALFITLMMIIANL